LNRTTISTVVCIPLTSNLRWADALGNVLLTAEATGLPQDSVANVSLINSVDRSLILEQVGHLSNEHFQLVLSGIDTLLGR
jgi:mRNA interferase MazF